VSKTFNLVLGSLFLSMNVLAQADPLFGTIMKRVFEDEVVTSAGREQIIQDKTDGPEKEYRNCWAKKCHIPPSAGFWACTA